MRVGDPNLETQDHGAREVPTTVLATVGLVKEFHTGGKFLSGQHRTLRAVNEVSLSLQRGTTLGIVGESGCGKSTLAKLALGLEAPTAGSVLLMNEPLKKFSRKTRARTIQLVMQDPYLSLNPRMTVYDLISEAYIGQPSLQGNERRRDLVAELLSRVGLGAQHLNKFPQQLSGGQRQRVGIARALAPEPSVLVCDEPVSALDVSVQAQVLNLLRTLQRELDLSYVFISHDLGVVRYMADRIAVMYLGRVVEEGPSESVHDSPEHPYTQALLVSASSEVETDRSMIATMVRGELPDPQNPPSGCPFRTRCWKAQARCSAEEPISRQVGSQGQWVRCHFPESEASSVA